MIDRIGKGRYAHFDMEKKLEHLAIIMDGNRRWAKDRGLAPWKGHEAGYERLKQIGEACLARGIKDLTVFAFSTENWKRTQEEVGFLMGLFEKALTVELDFFASRNLRLRILGRREGLGDKLMKIIENAEESTAGNKAGTLALCINYGGRPEIVDVCKKLIAEGVTPEEVTEEAIARRLYWPDMPDPDLIIRTSGEERLSGFLAWEGVYSELYWCQKHWPDFDENELDKAIGEFDSRQRRYGG